MLSLFSQPQLLIAWLVGIVYAITIHEFSHAYASYLEGDHTAADSGRLTLNPLKHLDPIGFIVLLIAGFGWGRPVPFNPYNLKHQKWGPVLLSLAGPASNVISFIVFGFLLKLLLVNSVIAPDNLLTSFLLIVVEINFVLAIFNLLPFPPLDGSKLLYAILPYRFQGGVRRLEVYGPWILLMFVVLGGSLFSALIGTLYNAAIKIFG
ncbi:MAG: site-2 protease family protein [Patescibacteria group bacterium]